VVYIYIYIYMLHVCIHRLRSSMPSSGPRGLRGSVWLLAHRSAGRYVKVAPTPACQTAGARMPEESAPAWHNPCPTVARPNIFRAQVPAWHDPQMNGPPTLPGPTIRGQQNRTLRRTADGSRPTIRLSELMPYARTHHIVDKAIVTSGNG
jgi:hypothetical protein